MSDTWIIVLILLFVLLCALVLLVMILVYVRDYWRFMDVPHQEPKRLMQVFHDLTGGSEVNDERDHYLQIYQRFKGTGPFCGFYYHLQPRVLVLERELVKQILIKDFSNFNDHGVYSNTRDDPLSADLYSRHDQCWREMRVKLEPIFAVDMMRQMYAGIYDDGQQLLNYMAAIQVGNRNSNSNSDATSQNEINPNEEDALNVEMLQHMRRYVLRSLARCVFGLNANLQRKYPISEFADMTQLALTTHRHGGFLSTMMQYHPTFARHLRLVDTNKKVTRYFHALIEEVVSERDREPDDAPPHSDYLQLLIDIKTQELNTHETNDEKEGEPKSLRQHLIGELSAHAITFLKSGLEPTANTLAHVLYELAENQAEQLKVRKELHEALARHNNELSYECVQELQYMWQVIQETVRLHPHRPYLIRRTLHDYRVHNESKYFIRKDMEVIIPIDAMHHDQANYSEPYAFKPTRFDPETERTRDQCLWMGFGEGPRNCIGQHFAQLQMRVALAFLLQHYQFRLDMRKLVIKYQDGVSLIMEPLPKNYKTMVDEIQNTDDEEVDQRNSILKEPLDAVELGRESSIVI